jgi:hypothetical protein
VQWTRAGSLGSGERLIAKHGDEGVQFRVVGFDLTKVGFQQFDGRELAIPYLRSHLRQG